MEHHTRSQIFRYPSQNNALQQQQALPRPPRPLPYPTPRSHQASHLNAFADGNTAGQSIQAHPHMTSHPQPVPSASHPGSHGARPEMNSWMQTNTATATSNQPHSHITESGSSSAPTGGPSLSDVKDMVDAVLNPTQQMLSHAWKETTQMVQTELQGVHAMYSGLLRYEKSITEQAIETCKQLRAELNATQDANTIAEAKRAENTAELSRVKSENEELKKQLINFITLAQHEVEALRKKHEQDLNQARERLREDGNLTLTLMIKLQNENVALMDQLRRMNAENDARTSVPAEPPPAATEMPNETASLLPPDPSERGSPAPSLSEMDTFLIENQDPNDDVPDHDANAFSEPTVSPQLTLLSESTPRMGPPPPPLPPPPSSSPPTPRQTQKWEQSMSPFSYYRTQPEASTSRLPTDGVLRPFKRHRTSSDGDSPRRS